MTRLTRSVNAVDIVRKFRRVRALVLGDAMLDTYLLGSAARLCSEGPAPVVAKREEYRVPGGAANTAANMRALGAQVIYLGVIGNDLNGGMLRDALHRHHVSDRWLIQDSAITTLHKLRIIADGQYVVRLDEGEARACAQHIQRRMLSALEVAYPQCDVVVVSDYGYGAVSGEVIACLKRLREGDDRPLIVDSKQLARFREARATVITPNALEARLLVQANEDSAHGAAPLTTAGSVPEADRISRQLLDMFDAEHVAITLAADGVLLASRNAAAVHLPSHRVTLASDVGAGDSFASALALALAAGASLQDAARIGIDCASIAIGKRFTAVVEHQELLQQVSLREHADLPTSGTELRRALGHLQMRLRMARQAGRKIVFTNGVFDLLHAGHVEFLRQLKGSHRPIIGEGERLALVAALDPVDHVILFDEENPTALIRALRPDVHVKGGDYATETLPEAEAVRDVGGEIVILPLVGDLSTSRMIERIVTSGARRLAGGQ